MEKQPTVINATEQNDSFSDAGKTSPEEGVPPSSKVEETDTEQYEAEVIENVEDADQHKHDDHIWYIDYMPFFSSLFVFCFMILSVKTLYQTVTIM